VLRDLLLVFDYQPLALCHYTAPAINAIQNLTILSAMYWCAVNTLYWNFL